MYMKLNSFKTKIEGSSLNTTLTPGKKFLIKVQTSLDDFIKKEIDHMFSLNQVLNSVKFQT